MNKTSKKILGIAAVALLISVALVGAGAAEVSYSWNGDTVTYTGSGELTSKIVSASLNGFAGNTFKAVIGNGITSIGNNAFSWYAKLTSVTIPDSVTSIEMYAFEYCTGLTSVTIPSSVTSIGIFAFGDCTSLTSINVDNNNTSYSSINGVLFNKSETELIQCPARKSGEYNIPDSVTSIEMYAFEKCTGLTSVTIGNGVTSIGDFAFSGCTGLTSITVNNNNTSYSSIGGVLFNKSETELIQCPAGKSGEYNISDSVTSIGKFAFYSCAKLTSINVDNNNTSYSSINGVLFNKGGTKLIQCPAGKSGEYEIPNGVTSIEKYAFENCTGLTSVTIGNGVTSIGGFAFSGCTGLTSVTIPSSVTSIGILAFEDCTSLTSITVNNNNPNYSSTDGVLFNKSETELIQCPAGKSGDYRIPNSVTSIEDFAFFCCTGLTSITIPNTVTSIKEGAFENCTGLTSVTIPDSVTSIGDYAFSGCTGLMSVTIPDSVETIGQLAFYGCTKLTSVTIGSGVTAIGNYAFDSCTNLKRINLTGVFTEELSQNFGSDVFYSCYGPIYIVSSGLQFHSVITKFIESIVYGTSYYIPVCYITNVDESELASTNYFVVDMNGGVLADNFVQSYYSYLSPELPTSSDISRTGYSFGGWYKDAALTEEFDDPATLTSENKIAYAKWTKIPASSSVTSFRGVKDGNDFVFKNAVVITKATLPGASSATVTNTSGAGWYTCNLTTDSISGNGILYFQVPLDVIDIKGYTINDVSMLGCKTTYLKSENGYAKYSAVITKGGALTIDFEKDAATAAVEKVQEVVEQKQTATEQKQAAAEKVQETAEQKQTTQTAAKSPFPLLGILAGLGAAAFFLRRR